MNYCYPQFFRSSGLGNRLFPWARCQVYAKRHALPVLAAQWAHVRQGPLRRGGINYRNFARKILLWGNFRPGADELAGLGRSWRLLTLARTPEPPMDELPPSSPGDRLIVFSGDQAHFGDLQGSQTFLHERLRRIAKREWLDSAARYGEVPIGINVRRGKDFADANSQADYVTRGALRTPLDWYVAVLRKVRQIVGYPALAFVVSDGTSQDLASLLGLENVELVRSDSAISDLLILAKSRVLIGSGGSSFSAWAAFLSGAPSVTYPGQSLQWFKVAGKESGQYVGEFDAEADPDADWQSQVQQALRREANGHLVTGSPG